MLIGDHITVVEIKFKDFIILRFKRL